MSSEIPDLLSQEQIKKLLKGEVITLLSSLESSKGEPISLECYIIPSPNPRKWILITAIAGQVEIGFADARPLDDVQRGLLEAPHFSRSGAYDAPHSQIRTLSGDDGFFVIPSERKRGVGQKIFDALRAVLKGLGAHQLVVQSPSEGARSFYQRNGGKEILGGFQHILTQENKE